jgi:hypothetical protein
MSNEFITLTLTALEYQEGCTNIAHRTALMLHEKGYISEEEFLKKTAKVKELTVAEIEALLGYQIKVVK